MLSYMNQGAAFYRDVWRLTLPIVLQNLIASSLALADTFMVGLLPGDAPMAAVTLANIPIFVVQLMIFGLQSGASVLISQFWGKGDRDSINRVLGIGLYVAGTFTALFAMAMLLFPVEFIGLFSNNRELVLLAAEYARPVGFSYFFGSLTQVYVAAHRSMENPKLGLYLLSISMVTNTFLNWVLIFGKLGAPAMGVAGAAVATIFSRIIEFAVTVGYALRSKHFPLQPGLMLRPGRVLLSKYIRFSTPVLLNETLWGLGTALFPTIMGYMDGSTEILAAHAISDIINRMCTVAVFAVAGTAAIIIGREIGMGRPRDEVYGIGKTLSTLSILLGTVVGVFMFFGTHLLISPLLYPRFGLSAEAQAIATMMLLTVTVVLPLRAFNATNIVGVLRGGGDVRWASFIDVAPLWVVALPAAAVLGLVLGVDIRWVYLSFSLENVVKFFLGVNRLRSRLWIHDLTQISLT